MSIDINDIAGLLHVEEKLRAHGEKFKNMLAAVRTKLEEHEAAHAPKPEPAPEPAPASEAETSPNGTNNGAERRV